MLDSYLHSEVGCLPLTSDPGIYRAASVLIRDHGEEVDLVADQRADSFLEAGDMAGSAPRRLALKALVEIPPEEPEDGEAVN